MGNFFRAIGRFFARIVGITADTADALKDGIVRIEPYIPKALEVVTAIAALTPTRTDDEIIAAARQLGVVVTTNKVSTLLRDVAAAALRKAFPDATERDINRAIEVAMGATKP